MTDSDTWYLTCSMTWLIHDKIHNTCVTWHNWYMILNMFPDGTDTFDTWHLCYLTWDMIICSLPGLIHKIHDTCSLTWLRHDIHDMTGTCMCYLTPQRHDTCMTTETRHIHDMAWQTHGKLALTSVIITDALDVLLGFSSFRNSYSSSISTLFANLSKSWKKIGDNDPYREHETIHDLSIITGKKKQQQKLSLSILDTVIS